MLTEHSSDKATPSDADADAKNGSSRSSKRFKISCNKYSHAYTILCLIRERQKRGVGEQYMGPGIRVAALHIKYQRVVSELPPFPSPQASVLTEGVDTKPARSSIALAHLLEDCQEASNQGSDSHPVPGRCSPQGTHCPSSNMGYTQFYTQVSSNTSSDARRVASRKCTSCSGCYCCPNLKIRTQPLHSTYPPTFYHRLYSDTRFLLALSPARSQSYSATLLPSCALLEPSTSLALPSTSPCGPSKPPATPQYTMHHNNHQIHTQHSDRTSSTIRLLYHHIAF